MDHEPPYTNLTNNQPLDGIYSLYEDLENISYIINEAKKSGKITMEYEDRVKQLMIEVNFIGDILLKKYKEVIKLRYDILFDLQPEFVKAHHKLNYEDMTDETPYVKELSLITEIYIQETSSILQRDFQVDVNIDCSSELLEFLIGKGYVSKQTTEKQLRNLLTIQVLPKDERIVWIGETHNNQYAVKPLVLILNQLFKRKNPKGHGRKKWADMITAFFKIPSGEFPTNSINTVMSNIEGLAEKGDLLFNFITQLFNKYKLKS